MGARAVHKASMKRRDILNLMRQEGGDRFTTFFFVAIAAFTVACGLYGNAIKYEDTLIRLVPSDAVAYVHANGATAERLAQANGYKGPTPREAAIFARRMDDGLEWSFLLASDRPVVMKSKNAGDSASQLPETEALADARGMASLQGFIRPEFMTEAAASSNLKSLGSGVFSVALRPNGFTARIASGAGAPDNDFSDAGLILAQTVVDLIDSTALRPAAETPTATRAKAKLVGLLANTRIVPIIVDNTEFIFPDLSVGQIGDAMSEYAGVTWPEKKTFELPDGTHVKELRLLASATTTDSSVASSLTLNLSSSGGPNIQLKKTEFGAKLSKKSDFFDNSDPIVSLLRHCTGWRSAKHSFIMSGDLKMGSQPYDFSFIKTFLNAQNMLITSSVDSFLEICGYQEEKVDKLILNINK